MPVKIANTFRPTSPVAEAMSNLIASYAPPTAEEAAALDYKRSQAQLNRQKLAAPGTLQGIFEDVYNAPTTETVEAPRPSPATMGPMPSMEQPVDRTAAVQSALPRLAATALQSDTDVGKLMRAFIANAPGLKDTQVIDRAMLGAGDSYASTQGGFESTEKGKMDRVQYAVDNKLPTKSNVEAAALQELYGDDPAALLNASRGKGITISPDGTVQIGGYGPLTKTNQTKAQDTGIAGITFRDTTDRLMSDIQENPTSIGATGMVRGLIQDAREQGKVARKALGDEGPEEIRGALDEFIAPEKFDPSLVRITQKINALPYMAAKFIAGQTGQSVSDKDIVRAEKIVGDPTALLANPAKMQAAMDELNLFVESKISAYNMFDANLPYPRGSGPYSAPAPAPAGEEDIPVIDLDGNLLE